MKKIVSMAAIAATLILSLACGGGSSKSTSFSRDPITANEFALFNTVDSGFTAGSFSTINTTNFTVNKTIKTFSTSDIIVRGYERNIFAIGRFGADFVQRFDVATPSTEEYNYSTKLESETSQNPQDLIIKDLSKAYIPRYGSTLMWTVNLDAKTESDFKTGEIDLSQYADSDGKPEMGTGLIVGDKLFLIVQRLDTANGFLPTNTSYVVVIDTTTDKEINTGKAEAGSGLSGIALPAKNPGEMVFLPETGKIYVQCVGQYGSTFSSSPRKFTGGLVEIDVNTYETKLLIDDGDDNVDEALTATGTHGGLFSNIAIVDQNKGYVALYAGWQNLTLRTFNPTTGDMGSAVADFSGVDIRGLSVDQNGRLWVSTGAGITILDSSTDTAIQKDIDVGLIPQSDARFQNY